MRAVTTNAHLIREFHQAMGVQVPERPTVPSLDLLKLRRTLIAEEVAEVQAEFEALHTRLQRPEEISPLELAPLAHELADLLYVTYGALEMLGIDANAVLSEVHRANLSKVSGPKRADGKQLKPAGWQPANVQAVLEHLATPGGRAQQGHSLLRAQDS